MKGKTLKKLLAGFLAAVCLPLGSVTALAEIPAGGGTEAAAVSDDAEEFPADSAIFKDINWARTAGVTVSACWTKDGSKADNNSGSPLSNAVDGQKDNTNRYGIFGDNNRNESAYMQVDLGAVRRISAINMWRYWGDSRTYRGIVITLSKNENIVTSDPNPNDANYKVIYNSDAEDFHGFGEGKDATYPGTADGRTFSVDPENPYASYETRYIRVYMHGSSGSNENHIVELEAISHVVNWANGTANGAGATAKVCWAEDGADANNNSERPASMAIDGTIPDAGSNPDSNYAEFGQDHIDKSSYLQVDLGAVRSISAINMYRYWDNRTYNGTVITLSKEENIVTSDPNENDEKYKVVYNSDASNFHGFGQGEDEAYQEKSTGRLFMMREPYDARYIRVYMHGKDTDGGTNHIVELEALGRRVTVENITVSAAEDKTTLKPNETVQLTAAVTPENALNKGVDWSSGDDNIATVDADGQVTAVADGRVTITATAKDGTGTSGSIGLTVSESSTPDPGPGPEDPDPDSSVETDLQGTTFTIGNEYISREFSIADNKLKTTKITNKRTGGAGTVFTPAEGSEEFKIRLVKSDADPDPDPINLAKIDKSGWTAVADSYQDERVQSGLDGNAGALLDNNIDTIWHTKYNDSGQNGAGSTKFPYHVTFNLGKATTFQCFSYTPRKQAEDTNGNLKGYELYYSDSANALTADSDEWRLLKKGSFKYVGFKANAANPIYVNLDQPCTATQLMLKAVSANNGGSIGAGAEFDLHAEKAPETVQKVTREFVSSDLELSGAPVVTGTKAEINGVQKKGTKVTFSFKPYTFRNVEYTINEVIVMYEGDHFMRKYMEISVPDNQKANAVIDYIDLESLVTNDTDATWTIPTDAGGVVAMEQFKANLGQPIYIQGMFFGSEFPVTDNQIDEDDGTGYMRYYTGKSFARMNTDHQLTADGKYVTWQTVAGAARSTENEVIQADFFEYIKSIATPSEFRIQYNSWFDNMMRIDDDNILESFIEIDREMNKAGVRPFDSYVVDDGWNNYNKDSVEDAVRSGTTLNQSGFWEFNSKFPQGLTPSSELVKKFGSNFGVWIGPRGGYNFYGTMADILTENHTGSKAGGSIDVADRTYVKNFENMAIDWMEEYDVNYWKWDGFADGGQYGAFASADGVPGYANNHMTGGYHQMYHVTDLWEAWTDLMEHVRETEEKEKINKLWISLTCYVNPSPWYLQWANSVWIQCIHDQSNQGPSSSHLDRQLTYRDAIYYDYIKNHEFQFPLSNVYNHDPIYGTEGTGMNINTATDEQFQNYLYMQSTRGTAFWELYFSDSIMTDGKYEVTAEFLEWAEENYHILKNSKMFGESPNTDTKLSSVADGEENAYGFSCFDGTDGIISFRNSADVEKSVTITFDRTLGVPEDAGTLKYHMEHSHNLTDGTPTTGELVYGQQYTITLQPDEVRILRVSKDGDTKAPEIVRAYSDGEGTAVVKFNEKIKGGAFKINGQAATAELGADDATVHLTAAEGSLTDADVMTVTAEGVTDLAGNDLTDNERSFRYYSDNALVSEQHHTVNREEYLAKARDSLTGTNGFSVKAEIATGSKGQVVRQGEEYMLGINVDGKAYFVLNGLTVTSDTVVNDGYTHSVVGVKENNGMMKLYVDGELEGSAYKPENKYYEVKAADIVLGNTDFYGNVKAEIRDVADGYDVVKEESGSEDDVENPDREQNWASGKTVVARWTDTGENAAKGGDRPMTMAVDGVKNNTLGNYAEFGTDNDKNKSSYLQVDFGGIRSVSKVNLYRYWADSRTYGATVVALSENADFSDPTILYNSDTENIHGLGAGTDAAYAESSDGKTFTPDEPCNARYIRVYMCGRGSASGTNHVVELEALGTQSDMVADYTAVNQARALARFLLDNHTAHDDWYSNAQADFDALEAARAAIVDGKKANEQDAVDKMAADVFSAASKIRKTLKKKLLNALDKAELTTPEEFYTADSITKYNAVIAAAQAVYDNANATEVDRQNAINDVNEAPKKLVTLLSGAETELASAIEDAEKVQNNNYTATSWKAFKDAIQAAKNLMNRPVTAKKAADFTAAKTAISTAQTELALAKTITGVTVTAEGGKDKLYIGETLKLSAVVNPAGEVNDDTVTWSIPAAQQSVATVDEKGIVTGRAKGSVTVTATANGDTSKSDSVTLTVEERIILVSGITVKTEDNKTGEVTLNVNDTVTLKAEVSPENATNKKVEWTIPEDKKSIAELAVNEADNTVTVTANAAGEVTVTATAKDGSEKNGTITLKISEGSTDPDPVPVRTITVKTEDNKTGEVALNVDGTVTLKAEVSPENATNKKVEWSIPEDKKSIAELAVNEADNTATVTANAAGEVIVTATAKDGSGKSGTITLKISEGSTDPIETAKEELNQAIDDAKQDYPDEKKSEYTKESWDALQKALEDAEEVKANPNSTQKELEDAAAKIAEAIKGLKPAQGEEDPAVTTAKTQLGSAITSAEKQYPASAASKYTAASWSAYQAALKEAKRVQGLSTSTKADLDRVKLALQRAISGLTAAPAQNNQNQNNQKLVEQGKTYTVGNYTYKVTNLSAKKVEVTGMLKKTVKKIVVGNTVSLPDGAAYTIDFIGKNAFKKNTKATSIVIGKNVAKIGDSAFNGCKSVKKATINSTALTNIGKQAFAGCKKLGTVNIKSAKLKTVGKNAFKGIKKNATFKVPKKNLKKYKKLLTKKKIGQQVKVKK